MEQLQKDLERRRLIELDKIRLREIANKRLGIPEQDRCINEFISRHEKYLCLVERKKDIDKLHEEIELFKQDKLLFLAEKEETKAEIQRLTDELNSSQINISKLKLDIKSWETKYNTIVSEQEKTEDEYNEELEKITSMNNDLLATVSLLEQKIEHREIVILQNEDCIKKDTDFIQKMVVENNELIVQNKKLNENNIKLNEEVFLLRQQLEN
jgi:hypothetical protein